jgi:hypothetical protein
MIRYFLARGDRAGDAVITEGLDSVTCSNPPPSVNIATLGMKTYCSACKQEGFIAPRGPRLPGSAPNGKQWALSGDINICGCNPSPIFYAERGMSMSITPQKAVMLMGKDANTARTSSVGRHWISFALSERGSCSGLHCVARFDDGTENYGTFSSDNTVRFERFDNSSACSHLELLLDDDTNVAGSVTESLLSAIAG